MSTLLAAPAAPESLKKATFLCSIKEYWRLPEEPKTFAEFTDQYRPQDGAPAGLWELQAHVTIPHWLEEELLRDKDVVRRVIARNIDWWEKLQEGYHYTPENIVFERDGLSWVITPDNHVYSLKGRLYLKNIVTDNGATAMLKNAFNNAGSAIGIMNHMVISQLNQGCTTLTSAYTSGNAIPGTLAVASTPAAIAANTVITVSYGTANADNITITNATQASGSTSLTLAGSQGNWPHSHSIGDNVVPVPTTSDNPASVSNSADSGALSGGAYAFSGTGAGNRQVVITFTYNTATTPGNYTELYMSNAGTIASNSTATHLIFPPQAINTNTSLQVSETIKL